MKKVLFVCVLSFLIYATGVKAEIYHGIDINDVYAKSDWSSKEKIKDIIDDYALLTQYQKELSLCAENSQQFDCADTLADKVMKTFYNHNLESNMISYNNYVKATLSAYGVVYCLNKYATPAGTVCEQENMAKSKEIVLQYINALLLQSKQELAVYGFLKDYK